MFIVVLSGLEDRAEIKVKERPTQDQLCALLASGLFVALTLVNERGETEFHISGPRVVEFGRMRWGLLT